MLCHRNSAFSCHNFVSLIELKHVVHQQHVAKFATHSILTLHWYFISHSFMVTFSYMQWLHLQLTENSDSNPDLSNSIPNVVPNPNPIPDRNGQLIDDPEPKNRQCATCYI